MHISHSDRRGGAAIAAFRIHQSLCRNGIDSSLWVNDKITDADRVFSFDGHLKKQLQEIKRLISGGIVSRILKTKNKIIHSPQFFNSQWPDKINKSSADIVHVHWVCNEMLSVKDIGKIKKPIVWTFHDMWAVCGAEHYTLDTRWRDGYLRTNRPKGDKGFDLNRYTWKKKNKYWKMNGSVVSPSKWLSNIAKESLLFTDWKTSTIQYPLDTKFWRPINKIHCRQILDLPQNLPLIAIGNEGGDKNIRKGFDLFLESIRSLSKIKKDFGIIVFGQTRKIPELDEITKCFYFGYLDSISRRLVYSAADVFALPSKMDAFGMTVMEAQACNTPAVVYKTCGQQDSISGEDSGILVQPFDVSEYGNAIKSILEKRDQLNPRRYILENNNEQKIAGSYIKLYSEILKERLV